MGSLSFRDSQIKERMDAVEFVCCVLAADSGNTTTKLIRPIEKDEAMMTRSIVRAIFGPRKAVTAPGQLRARQAMSAFYTIIRHSELKIGRPVSGDGNVLSQ